MAKETFIVVMPVFNEGPVIGLVITDWANLIKKHPGSELLVINDGSTDNTTEILGKLKKKFDFFQIIEKANSGHGKTISLGYELVIKSHHEWIFQTDSDNQFLSEDFEKLWERRNLNEFVLGQRMNRKDPYQRILLSALSRLCIFALFGVYISDPNIPFRLIKRSYLKKLLTLVPQGVFAPNIFLSILAAKEKKNLISVPVSHLKRTTGQSSIVSWKLLIAHLRSLSELIEYRLNYSL